MKLLFFPLLLIFAQTTYADDPGGGLIHGDDYTYSLIPPKGWVLDNASGVKQGFSTVFYPERSTWQDSKVVMYTTITHFDLRDQKNVEQVIDYDIKGFNTYPEIKIEKKKPLKTGEDKNKRKAQVVHFLKDGRGNYQSVAYIGEKNLAVLITYSARSEMDFKEKYSAFENLVQSYHWLENVKVKIEPAKEETTPVLAPTNSSPAPIEN